MYWYFEVLKKYADFSGRARRREYWMFVLWNIIITFVLSGVDLALGTGVPGGGILQSLYELAMFIPSLAVLVRRLHDTDRSGWWALVGLVPFVGLLVLLVFMVLEGTSGPNRFGPDPKETPVN